MQYTPLAPLQSAFVQQRPGWSGGLLFTVSGIVTTGFTLDDDDGVLDATVVDGAIDGGAVKVASGRTTCVLEASTTLSVFLQARTSPS